MIKVAVKYGLLMAVLMVLVFLVYYFLDSNPLFELFGISWIIMIIFLFFSIKEFREIINSDVLAYWQGMTVGFITYSIYAVVFSTLIWVFISWIDTDLMTGYLDHRLNDLIGNKEAIIEEMSEEAYIDLIDELSDTRPWQVAIDFMMKFAGLGLFYSTVISFIMKRKEKQLTIK